ncbi:hypothetical protein RI367_001600 [Sorochytrium milnesiophthora]
MQQYFANAGFDTHLVRGLCVGRYVSHSSRPDWERTHNLTIMEVTTDGSLAQRHSQPEYIASESCFPLPIVTQPVVAGYDQLSSDSQRNMILRALQSRKPTLMYHPVHMVRSLPHSPHHSTRSHTSSKSAADAAVFFPATAVSPPAQNDMTSALLHQLASDQEPLGIMSVLKANVFAPQLDTWLGDILALQEDSQRRAQLPFQFAIMDETSASAPPLLVWQQKSTEASPTLSVSRTLSMFDRTWRLSCSVPQLPRSAAMPKQLQMTAAMLVSPILPSNLAVAMTTLASGVLFTAVMWFLCLRAYELKQASKTLQNSQNAVDALYNYAQTIVDAIPGCLLVIDNHHCIQAMNACGSKLFPKAHNQSFDKRVRMPDGSPCVYQFECETEVVVSPECDAPFPANLWMSRLLTCARGNQFRVALLTDITHKKNSLKALEAAEHASKASAELRKKILLWVCHQMRNPMQAIQGTVQNLVDDCHPSIKPALDVVDGISRHVQNLLDDVLDLMNVSVSTDTSPPEIVCFHDLYYRMLQANKLMMDELNVAVQVSNAHFPDQCYVVSSAAIVRKICHKFFEYAVKVSRPNSTFHFDMRLAPSSPTPVASSPPTASETYHSQCQREAPSPISQEASSQMLILHCTITDPIEVNIITKEALRDPFDCSSASNGLCFGGDSVSFKLLTTMIARLGGTLKFVSATQPVGSNGAHATRKYVGEAAFKVWISAPSRKRKILPSPLPHYPQLYSAGAGPQAPPYCTPATSATPSLSSPTPTIAARTHVSPPTPSSLQPLGPTPPATRHKQRRHKHASDGVLLKRGRNSANGESHQQVQPSARWSRPPQPDPRDSSPSRSRSCSDVWPPPSDRIIVVPSPRKALAAASSAVALSQLPQPSTDNAPVTITALTTTLKPAAQVDRSDVEACLYTNPVYSPPPPAVQQQQQQPPLQALVHIHQRPGVTPVHSDINSPTLHVTSPCPDIEPIALCHPIPAIPLSAEPTADLLPRPFSSASSSTVEDNQLVGRVTSSLLRKQGFRVSIAENGQVALDMIGDRCPFQVILMDLVMPVMDGFECTRLLRTQRNISRTSIPVIALTANAVGEEKNRCLESGYFNEYLTKPVGKDSLVDTIIKWHVACLAA